jgi:hypothetical protein
MILEILLFTILVETTTLGLAQLAQNATTVREIAKLRHLVQTHLAKPPHRRPHKKPCAQ